MVTTEKLSSTGLFTWGTSTIAALEERKGWKRRRRGGVANRVQFYLSTALMAATLSHLCAASLTQILRTTGH